MEFVINLFSGESKKEVTICFPYQTDDQYIPDIFLHYRQSNDKNFRKQMMQQNHYNTSFKSLVKNSSELRTFHTTLKVVPNSEYLFYFRMKTDRGKYRTKNYTRTINGEFVIIFEVSFNNDENNLYRMPAGTPIFSLQSKIFTIRYFIQTRLENKNYADMLTYFSEEIKFLDQSKIEDFLSFYSEYVAKALSKPKNYEIYFVLALISKVERSILLKKLSFFNLSSIAKAVSLLKSIQNKEQPLHDELSEIWNQFYEDFALVFETKVFIELINEKKSSLNKESILEICKTSLVENIKISDQTSYNLLFEFLKSKDCINDPCVVELLIRVCPDVKSICQQIEFSLQNERNLASEDKKEINLLDLNENEMNVDSKYNFLRLKTLQKLFVNDSQNFTSNFEHVLKLAQKEWSLLENFILNIILEVANFKDLMELTLQIVKYGCLKRESKASILDSTKRFLEKISMVALIDTLIYLEQNTDNLSFIYEDSDFIEQVCNIIKRKNFKVLIEELALCKDALPKCKFFYQKCQLSDLLIDNCNTIGDYCQLITDLKVLVLDIDHDMRNLTKIITRSFERVSDLTNSHFLLLDLILTQIDSQEKKKILKREFFGIVSKVWTFEDVINYSKQIQFSSEYREDYLEYASNKIKARNFTSEDTKIQLLKLSSNLNQIDITPGLQEQIALLVIENTIFPIDSKDQTEIIQKLSRLEDKHLIFELSRYKNRKEISNSQYFKKLYDIADALEKSINSEDNIMTYQQLKELIKSTKNYEKIVSFITLVLNIKPQAIHSKIKELEKLVEDFDKTLGEIEPLFVRYFTNLDEMKVEIQHFEKLSKNKMSTQCSLLNSDVLIRKWNNFSKGMAIFNESIVFKNLYDLAIRRLKEDTLKARIDLLEENKVKYIELHYKLTQENQMSLKEFESTFKGCNIKKELEILQQFGEITELCQRNIFRCFEYLELKNEIITNYESAIKVINIFGMKTTSYSDKLKSTLEEFKQDLAKESYLKTAALDYKVDFEFRDPKNKTIRLLRKFSKSEELFNLLKQKDENSISRKAEEVGEFGEDFITGKTIHDLLQARSIIAELINRDISQKIDSELITILKLAFDSKKFENAGHYLDECNKVITGILKLFDPKTQERNSKQKVRECYKYSEYRFKTLDEEEGFIVEAHIGEKKQNTKFQEILEAKSRSALHLTSIRVETQDNSTGDMSQSPAKSKDMMMSSTKENIDDEKMHKIFVEVIDMIQEIKKEMNSLYFSGHPVIPNYLIIMENGEIKEYNIQAILEELRILRAEWIKDLLNIYQKHYSLTFLYGRQIAFFYDFFIGLNQDKALEHKIVNLLFYLGAQASEIDDFFGGFWKCQDIKAFLPLLGEKLDDFRTKETFFITENHRITPGRMYYTNMDANNQEMGILSLYVNECGRIPHSKEILFCHKDTKWEWIVSFLYRVYHCKEKALFSVANAELLPYHLQSELINEIRRFKENFEGSIASRIVIITNDVKSLFTNQLRKMEVLSYINKILGVKMIGPYMKEVFRTVNVISSTDSGYGKSYIFRTLAKIEKKSLFYFPIHDSLDLKKISKKSLELTKLEDKIIHLGIHQIEDVNLLNKYLFNLLILKCCSLYDILSVIPKDQVFFIEVAPTYGETLLKKLQILNLFHIQLIKDNFFDELSIKVGNFQKECNYIYLYDLAYNNSQNDVLPDIKDPTENVSKGEIVKILKKDLLTNDTITYYQIIAYIKILGSQLEKFSNSPFLTIENLNYSNNVPLKVRNMIYLSIKEHTKNLVQGSYSKAFLTQAVKFPSAFPGIEDYLNSQKNLNVNFSKVENPKNLLVIFHEDGTLSIPTLKSESLPGEIKTLLSTDQTLQKEQKKFLSSGNYEPKYFIDRLKKITDSKKIKRSSKFDEKKLEDENYILLQDNFYKMVLIYLKFEAGIPVIIMGETGCGKTSLIRYLAQNILQIEFQILSFHAGITMEHLIDSINNIAEQAKRKKVTFWVVLDEVNTCNCLGLVGEILCEKSLEGVPLPDNLFFIATCNPYRERVNKSEEIGLSKGIKNKRLNLAYHVNMLPHNMMNFVFDFGALNEADEMEYIKQMINIISDANKTATSRSIQLSQQFLRRQEETSSASLREGKRFLILFNWFYKKFYPVLFGYKYASEDSSIFMALIVCYYVRMTNKDTRKEYLDKICEIWRKNSYKKTLSPTEFLATYDFAMKSFLEKFSLPTGIARNYALKENLFISFICIVNKLPLLICGKPGCSKTLAVRLLHQSMRGNSSDNPFFKNFPKLFSVSYQGSQSSTSEGIQSTFNRARKIQQDFKNPNSGFKEEHSAIVFFDEVGLAEVSENNPLKVLHNLLEPVTGDHNDEIGFIGISNWRLDASKMNRVVFLARAEPDEEDLKLTAREILNSYPITQKILENEKVLNSLSIAYHQLRAQQLNTKNADFHGTRDFYSMVKQFAAEVTSKESKIKRKSEEIIIDAIERNFGGQEGSIDQMQKLFIMYSNLIMSVQSTSTIDLIRRNFADENARYLMIITNSSYASYIISNHFSKENNKRKMLVGSKLEGDNNKEDYIFRKLREVTDFMEKGIPIGMQDFDCIYPSLYDLFNQNFEIIDDKKNCRIALASTTNPMRFVHDKFRCLVIVDQKDLKKMDPPFLNRFEKQILTLENTLSSEQKGIVKTIETELDSMITSKLKKRTHMHINRLIAGMGPQFIPGLILKFHSPAKNTMLTREEILYYIIGSASMEFMTALSSSEYRERNPKEYEMLERVYFEQRSDCFEAFLNKASEEQTGMLAKYLIYTYSNILEGNAVFKGEAIASFKEEKTLKKMLDSFIMTPEEETFVLYFEESDAKHLHLTKSIIDRLQEEKGNQLKQKKRIIIVLSLVKESKESSHYFPVINDWNISFIDSLAKGGAHDFKLMLEKNFEEICSDFLEKIEKEKLESTLARAFMNMNYLSVDQSHLDINEYVSRMITRISGNNKLVKNLKRFIRTDIKGFDWKEEMLCNTKYSNNYENFLDAFDNLLQNYTANLLTRIIWLAEEASLLDFLLFDHEEEIIEIFTGYLVEEIENLISKPQKIELKNMKNINQVNKVWGMRVPSSFREIEKLVPILKAEAKEIFKSETRADRDLKENMYALKDLYEKNQTIFSQCESFKILRKYPDLLQKKFANKYTYDIINFVNQTIFKNKQSLNNLLYQIFQMRNQDLEQTLGTLSIRIEENISNCALWLFAFEEPLRIIMSLFSNLSLIYENINNLCEELTKSIAKLPPLDDYNNVFKVCLDFIGSKLIPKRENLTIYEEKLPETVKLLNLLKASCVEFKKYFKKKAPECKFLFEISIVGKLIETFFKDKQELVYQYFDFYFKSNPDREFSADDELYTYLMAFMRAKQMENKELQTIKEIIHNEDSNNPEWSKFASELRVNLLVKYSSDPEKYKDYLRDTLNNDKFLSDASPFLSSFFMIKGFDSLPNEKSSGIQAILQRLQSIKGFSIASLIISELITFKFYKTVVETKQKIPFLVESVKVFEDAVEKILNGKINCLQNFYYLAKIKIFTKIYCSIFETTDFSKIPEEIHQAVKKVLISQEKINEIYRVYVIRDLIQRYGSINILEAHLKQSKHFEWITCIQTTEPKSLLDIPLVFNSSKLMPALDEEIELVREKLKLSESDVDAFKAYDFMKNCSDNISFCLTVVNNFYLKKNTPFIHERFLKWIENNDTIRKITSKYTRSLLSLSTSNFEASKSSILCLKENSNIDVIEISAAILNTASIFISIKDEKHAYSPLISGGLDELFTNLTKFFPPGIEDNISEIEKHYSAYKSILVASGIFSNQHPNYNIQPYVCSCGFPYLIGECTLPASTAICPSCGKMLGGLNHALAAHQNGKQRKITFQEVKTIVDTSYTKLSPGYFVVHEKEWKDDVAIPRELSPSAHNVLSIILDSLLYVTLILEKEDKFEEKSIGYQKKVECKGAREFLEKKLVFNWKKFKKIHKIDSQAYLFMNRILNEFYSLIINTKPITSNKERMNFEAEFDKKILTVLNQSPIRYINEQKTLAQKKSNSLAKIPQTLDLANENYNQLDESLSLVHYMTPIQISSFEDMKAELVRTNLNQKFPLVHVFFNMEEDGTLALLENLYPIIEFTDLLLKNYNFTITREESKKINLRECLGLLKKKGLEEKKLDTLFDSFKTSWNRIHKKIKKYACHTLVPKEVDMNTPISFCLPYDIGAVDKEQGMYMLGALEYLGEIQNNLITAIQNDGSVQKRYSYLSEINEIPIQSAHKNDIISINSLLEDKKTIKELMEEFWCIVCPDGRYPRVNYDYKRLEELLARKLLLGKKTLNYSDSLRTAQFQLEIYSSNNSAISTYIEKFGYEKLSKEQRSVLDSKLLLLPEKQMVEVYNSVETLIFHLIKTNFNKETRKLSDTMGSIPDFFEISQKTKDLIKELKIEFSHLIELQDIIEEESFSFLEKNIIKEYKKPLGEDLVKLFDEACSKFKTLEKKYIRNVLRRFCPRFLIGKFETSSPLVDYLGLMEELWDYDIENLEDMLKEFVSLFPKEIKILSAYGTYEYLKQKIEEEEKKNKKEDNLRQIATQIIEPGNEFSFKLSMDQIQDENDSHEQEEDGGIAYL